MASTATAPAPARVIVGPLITQGGFQYWYLACFPDCVIAVRQGIKAFFVLGLSAPGAHAFGLAGALLQYVLKPRVLAYRNRAEFLLKGTPVARLRMKPNRVYQISELKAVTYKAKKGAPIILSDLILETAAGAKTRYGIDPADFDKMSAQLKQMYPQLITSF